MNMRGPTCAVLTCLLLFAGVSGCASESALTLEKVVLRIVDSSTVEERKKVVLTDPVTLKNFAEALQHLDISEKGVPLSVVDLPAPEIELTTFTKNGKTAYYAFYWGDKDTGGLIHDNLLKEVKTGMKALRELVGQATELTPMGAPL